MGMRQPDLFQRQAQAGHRPASGPGRRPVDDVVVASSHTREQVLQAVTGMVRYTWGDYSSLFNCTAKCIEILIFYTL